MEHILATGRVPSRSVGGYEEEDGGVYKRRYNGELFTESTAGATLIPDRSRIFAEWRSYVLCSRT